MRRFLTGEKCVPVAWMQREARNPGQLILSMSRRAKPLISYRVIVNLISATRCSKNIF